ncbi:MAG: PucR family transcriptional regulator [Fusicatenibacter sp.]|nr:PucR family transcriptional regulator ligand-binding domain-containing protein [Fusicatenibacter sp.]
MAFTLGEVYTATKSRYHLELVAGDAGLSRILNWVYISEDLNTADFLQGGELVITTGVSSGSTKDWLYHFLETMISRETCGVILNMGKYLHSEDLTEEILSLCEKHNYALFTMPWEVHIYDITRDYYDRIFKDTADSGEIAAAFFSVIYRDSDYAKSIHVLEDNGYSVSGRYCVAVTEMEHVQDPSRTFAEYLPRISYRLSSYRSEHALPFVLLHTRRNLVLIWQECNGEVLRESMEWINEQIGRLCPEFELKTGIGGVAVSLPQLKASYCQAMAAISMAKYRGTGLYDYEEMGFFKLLLAIDDIALLRDYAEQRLGSLWEYDREHGSSYAETLHQYLLHGGSIQAVAAALYCHRNTVNYRIRMLREYFGLKLDDPMWQYDLMTAFLIREYLEIMGK